MSLSYSIGALVLGSVAIVAIAKDRNRDSNPRNDTLGDGDSSTSRETEKKRFFGPPELPAKSIGVLGEIVENGETNKLSLTQEINVINANIDAFKEVRDDAIQIGRETDDDELRNRSIKVKELYEYKIDLEMRSRSDAYTRLREQESVIQSAKRTQNKLLYPIDDRAIRFIEASNVYARETNAKARQALEKIVLN